MKITFEITPEEILNLKNLSDQIDTEIEKFDPEKIASLLIKNRIIDLKNL